MVIIEDNLIINVNDIIIYFAMLLIEMFIIVSNLGIYMIFFFVVFFFVKPADFALIHALTSFFNSGAFFATSAADSKQG